MSEAAAAVRATESGGKGFFRTFKDTFFWTANNSTISRVSDRSEEAAGTTVVRQFSDREYADGSNGSALVNDYTENVRSPSTTDSVLGKSKSKSKFLKKKEIISSSAAVPRVEICTGRKCKAKGSEQLLSAFEASSAGRVEIAHTTCMKACKIGMNVRVTKDGTTFDMHNEVGAQDCQQILCKHFEW